MREKLTAVIKDLKRCACQNDKDSCRTDDPIDAKQAKAVAAEQRRMIKILQAVVKNG